MNEKNQKMLEILSSILKVDIDKLVERMISEYIDNLPPRKFYRLKERLLMLLEQEEVSDGVVRKKSMNWQTRRVKAWLERSKAPIEGLTDSELEQWAKSLLIVTEYPTATARLKNKAMMELLKEVNWNELLNN